MTARAVSDTLARHRRDEKRRALRALLMRPLMASSDESFPALRRHAEELRAWLLRETGWNLHVERDAARLVKRPSDQRDGTRGAPGFDRRRYVLLCLLCSALERSESQITLRGLGEELVRLAADPALTSLGFRFALDQAHERRDLVNVCRYMIGCGVLHRVAGDEDAFVTQQDTAGNDALYDVHRRLLAYMLACARGPSTLAIANEPVDADARVAAMLDEYVPDSSEGRRTATRHALARRLLDDPVVYFDELSQDAREYFANQRGPLAARLAEAVDLVPEQRAEGCALIDPEGELSDAQLPAEGTLSHATLLVAEYLAEQLARDAARFVPESEVAVFVRKVADEFGRYWRKAEREPGAEVALAREALRQLVQLKLVTWLDGCVRARPALARFALGAPLFKQVEKAAK